MEILTPILLILILILLVLVYLATKKTSESSTGDSLTNAIIAEMIVHKDQISDKVIERMGMMSNVQNSNINDTKSKIEISFEALRNVLNNIQTQQSASQKSEFAEIKSLNQTQLMELQKMIQESLSKAIIDLGNLNSQNFETLRKTNQEKLDQINLQVQSRLDQNFAQHQKSFEEVTRSVGNMQTTARQMIDSTASIDKLNNIFARSSSKSFGDFGEKYLESLLTQNVHPSCWSKQVKMSYSADKIDFVLQFGDQKIGIDSKFPATRFQDYQMAEPENKMSALKDYLVSVKLMATDIAKKYGKNHEFDYLLMYLPSDGMYVTVAENTSLINELQKLGVMPVSPITIFPMIMGAKTYYSNKFVNENAKQIMQGLDNIKKNVATFQDEFRKLGDKIKQAQQNYDKAGENLLGVERTVNQLEHKEVAAVETLETQVLI
jgi:DNA recombination protein RmuC